MLHSTFLQKGRGAPLVFLHGFLGSPADWEGVVSFLSHRTCLGIELPGHGATPFTEHFCEAMPPFETPIHLIGYSMGGRLALQYAAQFPKKIASLTLLSTHLGLKTSEEREERKAQDATWAKILVQEGMDRFLARWYAQPIFGGFHPDLTGRRQQNPTSLARCFIHYSLSKQPLFSHLGLSLIGEKDVKYRQLYPHAQSIANAAHMVHLENPQGVAEALGHLKRYK